MHGHRYRCRRHHLTIVHDSKEGGTPFSDVTVFFMLTPAAPPTPSPPDEADTYIGVIFTTTKSPLRARLCPNLQKRYRTLVLTNESRPLLYDNRQVTIVFPSHDQPLPERPRHGKLPPAIPLPLLDVRSLDHSVLFICHRVCVWSFHFVPSGPPSTSYPCLVHVTTHRYHRRADLERWSVRTRWSRLRYHTGGPVGSDGLSSTQVPPRGLLRRLVTHESSLVGADYPL